MARKRHLSRIAVMQVLFERESRGTDEREAMERNLEELGGGDDSFASELLSGVLDKEEDIKKAVEEHAPEWSLDRMDPISRCVLLIGAYEILFAEDAPPAVVMNEAIDIAKEYGPPESGKFVNGVLNAIAHRESR
jgi:N utilization substance protein B